MDTDADNVAEYTCRAVSAFTGFPIDKIIFAQYETFSEPGLIDSVARIFAHALKLLSEAKGTLLSPDQAVFEYAGDNYRIPVILQQAIAGETILPGLSTIEVIEVAEVHRFKKQVTENTGDPDGSLIFTTFIKTLAILARKDGESLPFNDSEREAWIQNRAVHFSKIDAQTALNIDFFLTSILRNYENETPVAGFLSRQSFAVVAATRLKSAKRSTGRSRKPKKPLRRSAGVK